MDSLARIEKALSVSTEQCLAAAVSEVGGPTSPQQLATAIRHAVFPGGARIRPRLSIAVALACGDDEPALADAAASAIELLHCASLVHDDLPCFDNAAIRRGRLSVHKAFGERIAVLAGDALIVLAFQTLARGGAAVPHRLAPLLMILSRAVGMPNGIVAGQAWECEPYAPIELYQQAKTGALFSAATMAGAAASGVDAAPWRTLGAKLGAAFQVADDIRDVAGDPDEIGKPVGQDAANGTPNIVAELGLNGAIAHLESLVAEGIDSIPDCPGAVALRGLIQMESLRFLPKELQRRAA